MTDKLIKLLTIEIAKEGSNIDTILTVIGLVLGSCLLAIGSMGV